MTLYERWQREVVNSVFDMVNEEHDKLEKKLNLKPRLDDPVSGTPVQLFIHAIISSLNSVVFIRRLFAL